MTADLSDLLAGEDAPLPDAPGELVYLPVDEEPPFAGERATGARPAAPSGLHGLTWDDLGQIPDVPVPMLHAGIPRVGLTVLASPPKAGKTMLLCQRMLETPGRVLAVIEEGSLSGLAWRLHRQAESLGVTAPALALLHRQKIRLDDRRSVRELRAMVADLRPVMVGLDPLNRLHSADENKPAAMTPIMDCLANLALDFDCAVVALHHTSKPSPERRGGPFDSFRGASSIRSGTDSNLVMEPNGDLVHLVGEFRDAEPLSIHLKLDRDGLIFRPVDAPTIPGKIGRSDLVEFIAERGQVSILDVARRFACSKNTAQRALEACDLDTYIGPRGVLLYKASGL